MKTTLTMMTPNFNNKRRKLKGVALPFLFTISLLTSDLAKSQTKSDPFEGGTWEETKAQPAKENKFLFLDASTTCNAAQTIPNKFEIGFSLSQYQKDFGIGLHVVSPYFIRKTVAIKAGTNIQWFEDFKTTYQNIQLGIRGRSFMVTHNISMYGEGGPFIILPNSDFSSQSLVLGGYGLFGFEFKIVPRFAYFIELGAVGTGAIADKLESKPVYSNGFLTNVGLKIGF
jgi:hypothetical protein